MNVSMGNDVYFAGISTYSPDIFTNNNVNFQGNVKQVDNVNSDTIELSTQAQKENSDSNITIDDLKADFEQVQAEQGFIGKGWNWVKNHVGILSKVGMKGSDEIEEIIQKAENGEISVEEAKEAVEKYKKNQEKSTNKIMNIATGVVVSIALLAGPAGWAAIAVGAAVGAATRLGLGIAEAATNDVKGDYTVRDGIEDATQGAIIGAAAGAGKAAGNYISQTEGEEAGKFVSKVVTKIGKDVINNTDSVKSTMIYSGSITSSLIAASLLNKNKEKSNEK